MSNTAPTTRDLRRGLAEAQQELAAVQAAHGKLAFEYASNRENDAARIALATSKQRIRELEDEISDLSSATGEAQRHESIAQLDDRLQRLEIERVDALAAIDAMEAKWADVVQRIAGLGSAVPEFVELHARANAATRKQAVRHGAEVPAYMDNQFHAVPLLGGLLCAAIGMRLDVEPNAHIRDSGASEDVDVAKGLLSSTCERARSRIDENFNRARTEITDQRVSAARAA